MKNAFTIIESILTIAMAFFLILVLGPKVSYIIRCSKDSAALNTVSIYRTASNIYLLHDSINGFQDILSNNNIGINDQVARSLYSYYDGSLYKGLYSSGVSKGKLGFLEVGTNTSGEVIEKSQKPIIEIEMKLKTGEIVITQDQFNGKDTKSKKWYEY